MSLFSKAKKAIKIIRNEGFQNIVSILISNYGQKPFPLKVETKWKAGVPAEIRYWDSYFNTKGLKRPDNYKLKFDPNLPLQPRPASLLIPQKEIQILDVGAGPLTYLGRVYDGGHLNITAIDPLADDYDKIIDKYQVRPLIRTQKLAAEEIANKFQPNTFDLVFARNSIDHAYDPEKAILQMIDVVKSGRYILLEHMPNVADESNYSGLHQWNFSSSSEGDFLISSRLNIVNMTRKYAEICTITCEMVNEGGANGMLITKIQKR